METKRWGTRSPKLGPKLTKAVNRRIITTLVLGGILAASALFFLFPAHHLLGDLGLWGPPRPPRARPQGAPDHPHFPNHDERERFETFEVWRDDGLLRGPPPHGESRHGDPLTPQRPVQPPRSAFPNAADYLEQTLVADYASPRIDSVFLMLKTGATVMWDRLPMHLVTTLTRVKNFAIYSDAASSIGGYEVIDILKDLPEHILNDPQLAMYKTLKDLHDKGYGLNLEQLNLDNKGWDVDKFKNVPMLAHAYETSPDSEWFVFMDDDTYISWDNLDWYLSTLNSRDAIYLGSQAWFPEPREAHGKKVKFFAHGGSGVVISKGAMDRVFGKKATRSPATVIADFSQKALSECCGDLIVAWMLWYDAQVLLETDNPKRPWRRFQGEPIWHLSFNEQIWCEPVVTYHHTTPREIEILWEYERIRGHGAVTTYSDIYRDFVLPYLVEEEPDWYLYDFDMVYINEDGLIPVDESGSGLHSASSADNCKQTCINADDCMAWTHYDGFCGLQRGRFMRGQGCTRLSKDYPGSQPTSGWIVDRIKNWRAHSTCDKIDDEYGEGWFDRARLAELNEESDLLTDSSQPPDSSVGSTGSVTSGLRNDDPSGTPGVETDDVGTSNNLGTSPAMGITPANSV